jgi:hypothetical protein
MRWFALKEFAVAELADEFAVAGLDLAADAVVTAVQSNDSTETVPPGRPSMLRRCWLRSDMPMSGSTSAASISMVRSPLGEVDRQVGRWFAYVKAYDTDINMSTYVAANCVGTSPSLNDNSRSGSVHA